LEDFLAAAGGGGTFTALRWEERFLDVFGVTDRLDLGIEKGLEGELTSLLEESEVVK
jgi:hypothetical protein